MAMILALASTLVSAILFQVSQILMWPITVQTPNNMDGLYFSPTKKFSCSSLTSKALLPCQLLKLSAFRAQRPLDMRLCSINYRQIFIAEMNYSSK